VLSVSEVHVPLGVEQTVGVETQVIRAEPPSPTLRPGWAASRDEVLTSAAEVVALYQRLGDILATAKPEPGTIGHNQGPRLDELVEAFRENQRTAAVTLEVLRSQFQTDRPDPRVVKQSAHVFKTLAYAALGLGGFLAGCVVTATLTAPLEVIMHDLPLLHDKLIAVAAIIEKMLQ